MNREDIHRPLLLSFCASLMVLTGLCSDMSREIRSRSSGPQMVLIMHQEQDQYLSENVTRYTQVAVIKKP